MLRSNLDLSDSVLDILQWSQDIYYVVDMDYVDESDVVMFTVKLTLRCTCEL